MRSLSMNIQRTALLSLIGGLLVQPAFPAHAQISEGAGVTSTSAADGTRGPNNGSPTLTGARHPLYRLRKSDVVEIRFTFSPEFDQTVTVQPDGFVALKAMGDVFAEGSTISELRDSVRSAYATTLRDPEVSVILSDFERPFFLAGGQVGHPGKFELRSPISVAEAIAIAGGFTEQSKHSQVVLFRKVTDGIVEARVLNMKAMLASRNLEEDLELKPGDMVFVPQNRISKIRKFLPVSSLSTFFTPAQF
ncbi:MAG: polysaccharide export protein [Acidobacteriaceae bacterium]|nr:polysaccharide export protein [Acidobacteriaceae bacterium]